jgi:hypothetical protein
MNYFKEFLRISGIARYLNHQILLFKVQRKRYYLGMRDPPSRTNVIYKYDVCYRWKHEAHFRCAQCSYLLGYR